MNPPPDRPDDHNRPPTPRPDGAPTDPPAHPPGRDPLLDDPLFAELVDGRPAPDLPMLEPARPAGEIPLVAEPVAEPDAAALPVAEVVRAQADAGVIEAEPADEPVPGPRPRPVPRAEPVRPSHPSARPRHPDPDRRRGPAPADADQPRPRVMTACGVIGCFALVVIGAIGFLAYVAISVLGHLGDRMTDRPHPGRVGEVISARPGPVVPSDQIRNTTVTLPGRVDAVGRGAGGRFLLLRIPKGPAGPVLAVFDPNQGEVVETVPLGEPDALFAAGAAKLFVYKRQQGVLERYDLSNLKHGPEHTAHLPAGAAQADAVVVGARSDGPVHLLAAGVGKPGVVRTFDAGSLEQIGGDQLYSAWRGRADGAVHARASDDGKLVGVAGEPAAVLLRLDGDGNAARTVVGDDDPPRYAVPSPDGQFVYTPRGVFRPEWTRIARPDDDYFFTFPPAQGNAVYLSLNVTKGDDLDGPLRLHFPGPSRQTVGTLNVPVPKGVKVGVVGDITPEERVHLWPAAGLAAVLPATRDTIEVRKVDVAAALKAHGGDYLVVGSDPPTTAVINRPWSYRPAVWPADAKNLRLTVTGPAGMKVRNGEITWTPPPGHEEAVEVVVEAVAEHTFAVGNLTKPLKTEQKFKLVVVDEPDR